jgi:hypothetical protein
VCQIGTALGVATGWDPPFAKPSSFVRLTPALWRTRRRDRLYGTHETYGSVSLVMSRIGPIGSRSPVFIEASAFIHPTPSPSYLLDSSSWLLGRASGESADCPLLINTRQNATPNPPFRSLGPHAETPARPNADTFLHSPIRNLVRIWLYSVVSQFL